MDKDLQITFALLIGEDHVSVEDCLKDPKKVLDYYLNEEDLSDSTFQGGFCITNKGKKWNATQYGFYFDLFAYTLNWLSGMIHLLRKEGPIANVGFWEESVARATLLENGDLEIVDASVNGRVLAEPAEVDFETFCKELLTASKQYEALASQVKVLALAQPHAKNQKIIREMCAEDYRKNNEALALAMSNFF